jgi:hypothetical protein
MAFSGSGFGTLSRDFGSLAAGTAVSTSLDIQDFDVAGSFDLVDLGPVRISPGLGLDFMGVDMTVRGIGTERIDERYTLPFLFLQGEVGLGPLGAVVDLAASDLELGGHDMESLDVSGMLVYGATVFEAYVGYRSKSFEAFSDDPPRRAVDLDLRGWFLGVGASF